jgi:hypothetical protein
VPTLLRETLVFEPRFVEGSYDPKTRTVDVTIITEGLGNKRDKHFYPADVLRRAVAERVFEGAQAYADHPSKFDDSNRPERSVRDLVGYYFNVHLTTVRDNKRGAAVEAVAAKFKIQEGCDWVDGLIRESISYRQKFPDMNYTGISINADGDAEPVSINGQNVKSVTHISEVISADVVTKPARGGGFIKFAESARGASQRRKAMLKTAVDAASRLERIAEGESVEPKELLAIATQLREAGGAKCAECGHMMHEGACDAKGCECAGGKSSEADKGDQEPDEDDQTKEGDKGDGDSDHLEGKTKESLTIDDLKKKYPSFYAAALKEAHSHVADEKDTLQRENIALKAQIALHESQTTAINKLEKAKLPPGAAEKVMISLIGQSPDEMDRIIEAEVKYAEAFGWRNGKLIEGAGPRNNNSTQHISVRESEVSKTTQALVAGVREVAY